MAWPQTLDYNAAIQNLRSSFGDPGLRQGEPALNAMGLPMPRSGNFADVYEVRSPATGQSWAVKCFKREVPGLKTRYQQIAAHLKQARLPFMVDFDYLERGVLVQGAWYPILKMAWIEGFSLNQFVRDSLDKPGVLKAILRLWALLAKRLREAQIAHGDLQHGNVILVPVADSQSLGLRLIDYDGMFVPSLANTQVGEAGHPNFQHPHRTRDGGYNIDSDRFSHLVICCAIRSLIAGGRRLWDRFDNGDNLLFREQDFLTPATSPLFQELWKTSDAEVRNFSGHLLLACAKPLDEVPTLDTVFVDGAVQALSAQQTKQVDALLRRGASHIRPVAQFVPGSFTGARPTPSRADDPNWRWGPRQTTALPLGTTPVQPGVRLGSARRVQNASRQITRGILLAVGVWLGVMLLIAAVRYGPGLGRWISQLWEGPPSTAPSPGVTRPGIPAVPPVVPSPQPQPQPQLQPQFPAPIPPATAMPAPIAEPKPEKPALLAPPASQENPLLAKVGEKAVAAPPKAPARDSAPSPIGSMLDSDKEEPWNRWASAKASQIGGHFFQRVSLTKGETTINLARARGTSAGGGVLSSNDVVSRKFALGAGKLFFGNDAYSFGDREFDAKEPLRMYEIPELAKKLGLLSVRVELRADDADAQVIVEGDADLAAAEERLEKIKKPWGVIVRSLNPARLNDRPFRELSELLHWNVMVLGDDRKALREALASPVHQERDRLERVLKAHASESSSPSVDRSDGLRQLREGCREVSFVVYKQGGK